MSPIVSVTLENEVKCMQFLSLLFSKYISHKKEIRVNNLTPD